MAWMPTSLLQRAGTASGPQSKWAGIVQRTLKGKGPNSLANICVTFSASDPSDSGTPPITKDKKRRDEWISGVPASVATRAC